MKYEIGQRVRITRGIFKGRGGIIKDINKRFSSPYLVKVNKVTRTEHFTARDLATRR